MMVRERVLDRRRGPRAQRREKARRVADRGHRVHRDAPRKASSGRVERRGARAGAPGLVRAASRARHRARARAAAGPSRPLTTTESTSASRAAARAAGRPAAAAAVAEAARAVDDRDLEVAAQCVVLQAVVADHDVDAPRAAVPRLPRERSPPRPASRHGARAAAARHRQRRGRRPPAPRAPHAPRRHARATAGPAAARARATRPEPDRRTASCRCRRRLDCRPPPPARPGDALRSQPRRNAARRRPTTAPNTRAERPQPGAAPAGGVVPDRLEPGLHGARPQAANCSRCSWAYMPSRASSSACVPALDHPPLVEHDDQVGLLDGREPVRDHQRGAAAHQPG
jgi:hypothetical protein